MDAELKGLLERVAVGVERLAEDPVIQMETAPPVCPHCEHVNPVIRVQESEQTGLIAEFVIQADCQHCHKVFYAFPIQWACMKSTEEVRQVISERIEAGGYNGNVN